MEKRNYIIYYDISDAKLSHQVRNLFKRKGLIRIQKSVYLGTGKSANIMNLLEALTSKEEWTSFSIISTYLSPDNMSNSLQLGGQFPFDIFNGGNTTIVI